MRRGLALLACIAILVLYFFLAALLGWEEGGGAIVMAVVFGIMVTTWTLIAKGGKPKAEQGEETD